MSGIQISYTFGNDVFHLKSRLGSGAFGTVFLAFKNDNPGEEVAIKRIVFNQTTDSSINNVLSHQLLGKWKTALSLDHPNLVRYLYAKIYDNPSVANQQEGLIVLEYCNGGSLDNYLKTQRKADINPPMSLSAVKSCTKDILEGLAYLHSDQVKITHTDLKPANILLRKHNGQIVAKIADFDDHVAIIATITRFEVKNTKGSAQYQSSESIDAKDDFDIVGRRTDIWSLGCIVVEIARGSQPFKLIKMDGVRPVPTDYLLVNQETPDRVLDFIAEKNAVPEIPQNEILGGFVGLDWCFKRNVAERPRAEELLQDIWFKGGPWVWQAKDQLTVVQTVKIPSHNSDMETDNFCQYPNKNNLAEWLPSGRFGPNIERALCDTASTTECSDIIQFKRIARTIEGLVADCNQKSAPYRQQPDSFYSLLKSIIWSMEVLHNNGICGLDFRPNQVFSTSVGIVLKKRIDTEINGMMIRNDSREAARFLLYCAPEVIRGVEHNEKTALKHADIWGFGCLSLYILSEEDPQYYVIDVEGERRLLNAHKNPVTSITLLVGNGDILPTYFIHGDNDFLLEDLFSSSFKLIPEQRKIGELLANWTYSTDEHSVSAAKIKA